MSTDSNSEMSKTFDLEAFMKALDIGNEVKKICEEAVDRVLKAALPPDMAEIATAKPCDYKQYKEKAEKEALDAAAAGTGPQPYDREWHTNYCDTELVYELLRNNEIGWHLINDLFELTTWAISSAEAQRALSLDGDPVNGRQHLISLLKEIREALITYRRDLLLEHAEDLGWDEGLLHRALMDEKGG